MDFHSVIAGLTAKANPEANPEANPVPVRALTENDFPLAMPLTNRLDKMNVEQGRFAIANGDAWLAYLKEQKANGVDVDIVEHKPIEAYDPPTPAEKFQAVCDIVEKVWLDLTDNMKRPCLRVEQIPDWVSTVEWAIKALPEGYEKQRDIFQDELAEYQPNRKRKEGKNDVG